MEIIGFDAEVPSRSITSSHTLPLDPQTLWKRGSQSQYTVAHQKGSRPEVVMQRWKKAGVLRQGQAMHQTADGGFVPGFAQTMTIDDPVLLDQVLALAAADTDEQVQAASITVVNTVEVVGDLEDVQTGVEIHNLPEDALVAVDPKDKTQVVVFTAKQVKEAHEAPGGTSVEFVPLDKRMWLLGSTVKHLLTSKAEPVLKAPLTAVPSYRSHEIYGSKSPAFGGSKTAA